MEVNDSESEMTELSSAEEDFEIDMLYRLKFVKRRLIWTDELKNIFEKAIEELKEKKSQIISVNILNTMTKYLLNPEKLTNTHVSSHLQKYRTISTKNKVEPEIKKRNHKKKINSKMENEILKATIKKIEPKNNIEIEFEVKNNIEVENESLKNELKKNQRILINHEIERNEDEDREKNTIIKNECINTKYISINKIDNENILIKRPPQKLKNLKICESDNCTNFAKFVFYEDLVIDTFNLNFVHKFKYLCEGCLQRNE